MIQLQSNMCPHSVTALVPFSGVRSSMHSVHRSIDCDMDSMGAVRSWAAEISSFVGREEAGVGRRVPVLEGYASGTWAPGGGRPVKSFGDSLSPRPDWSCTPMGLAEPLL